MRMPGRCDGCGKINTVYLAVIGEYWYWHIYELYLCLSCCGVLRDRLDSISEIDVLSVRLKSHPEVREVLVHDAVFQEETGIW